MFNIHIFSSSYHLDLQIWDFNIVNPRMSEVKKWSSSSKRDSGTAFLFTLIISVFFFIWWKSSPHTITSIGQLPRTYPTKLRCCDISSYKLSNESTCLVFQGPSKLTFPSDNWLEYKRGTPPVPLCTVSWTPRRFNYEAFGEDSTEGGNFGHSL